MRYVRPTVEKKDNNEPIQSLRKLYQSQFVASPQFSAMTPLCIFLQYKKFKVNFAFPKGKLGLTSLTV
jgi:hypothetical protein